MEYKRLTQWTKNGASLILDNPQNAEEARAQLMEAFKLACNKLAELEDKIEQGKLIECNPKLIGECIVGIHQYTDGTYAMDFDEENIVIGFCSDSIVTANTTHAYNDYFKHGLYFIDNEEGRAEATNKLKELQNG